MSRIYAVCFSGVAVTAGQDLFEIGPAADHPVKLLGLFISQSSEVGDAAEEMMRLEIIRGHTSSGSGGSAATPVPIDPADPAAGFAAEINNTTIASSGSTVVLHSECLNERVGMGLWWTPECAPMAIHANTTIVVRLIDAPADSVTMSGTLYVEEM